MQRLVFAVIDFETTGLDYQKDEIIDLGIVRMRADGEILAQLGSLIRPSPGVYVGSSVETHGITDEDLRSAPPLSQVIDQAQDLLEGAVLVAHKVSFETKMWAAALAAQRREWQQPPCLCTIALRTQLGLGGYATSTKLQWACWLHGIHQETSHRALADAESTALLLSRYLQLAHSRGIKTLNGLGPGPGGDETSLSWSQCLRPYPPVEIKKLPQVSPVFTDSMKNYYHKMRDMCYQGLWPRQHLEQLQALTYQLQLTGGEISIVHRVLFDDLCAQTKVWDAQARNLAWRYGGSLGLTPSFISKRVKDEQFL